MTRYVAATVVALGTDVFARLDPRTGSEDDAERLARTVWNARRDRAGIEAVKRAGREAWDKFHGGAS